MVPVAYWRGNLTYQRAKLLVAAVSAVAIAGVVAVPQATEAMAGTTLYVSNTAQSCTDSGAGEQASPYCTIQAAAHAAAPGDTVVITGNDYLPYPATTISTSGTAAAPITFEVTAAPYFRVAGLTITGSHIDVLGAYAGSRGHGRDRRRVGCHPRPRPVLTDRRGRRHRRAERQRADHRAITAVGCGRGHPARAVGHG